MNCPPDESMMEDRHSLYLTYVQWFALVLIRLQLHFHISNRAINLIVTAFAAFLSLISHPVQSIFPSTLYSFLKLSAVNKNTYIVLYVVCPNGECNTLYKIKEVRHADKRNQQPCCTAKHFGKRCSEPLAWLKKLAFGTSRLVPYKTFIYTTPSAWLRKFTQREEFDRLLEGRFHQDRPDGGTGRYMGWSSVEGLLSRPSQCGSAVLRQKVEYRPDDEHRLGSAYLARNLQDWSNPHVCVKPAPQS